MKTNFITLITITVAIFAKAQTPISLEKAYQLALDNNLSLKNGGLKINYQDRLKNSAVTIDPLNISAEYGQMNSVYADNKISVSQTLKLPKFYNAQKQVLLEEWKSSVLNLELQKWQLKREIALIYNELNYYDEKKKLLQKTDSIFSQYYKRADLRLKKGESNLLEKATAENLRSQAEMQLKSLEKEKKIASQKLSFFINDGSFYQNENSDYQILGFENLNSEYAGNPLVMKQLEQEKNIQNAKLLSEKAKLSPSFNVGVNSMTMYGNGADNQFYDRGKRFQSGLVGIGLPIFNSAQKSVIEAQKVNQQIAENNYQLGLTQLKNQFLQHLVNYQKLKDEVSYYQNTGLQNSESILKTANNQYFNGEINYLEWTLLITQALEIQNKYVDKLKDLNDKIIELNALKSE